MAPSGYRHPDAIWRASPNINDRRHGGGPDMVIVHHTAMASAEAALDRLCDTDPPEGLPPVSCHYLISETGGLWQMVDEKDRAWHAGLGAWGDVKEVNSRSVGIELANTACHPYPEPQMAVLEDLLSGILSRWSIPPERVIGHSDMAPHRKSDPGARFDWRRLAWRGLAIWPEAGTHEGEDEAGFAANLERIGYRAPEVADAQALLLWAFRLRFRPWAAEERGALDAEDCRIAADIARRYPAKNGGSAAG
ncbi:N-acetylmuramoyl-L-alanine amidase [Primorskyibacter flagellatus]|uniref:N-acetylmuramoyl-L-alanine amidase n=2 Tax=Primorskyibacter flagellatus TaxID=1387277 RepID=A0A916ZZE6_9RHOB|nr:N-acetylmuramoyl-L-alanine amidase [Primorskyibacter flagellatus]